MSHAALAKDAAAVRRARWMALGQPLLLLAMFALAESPANAQRVEPPIAEDLATLEQFYDDVRSGTPANERLNEIVALKLRMTQREVPPQSRAQERRDFARAWKLIGAIGRELEGDTPEVVEYYRIANSLDPEDEEIAKELVFRQRKLDAVNERIEEARLMREIDEKSGRN